MDQSPITKNLPLLKLKISSPIAIDIGNKFNFEKSKLINESASEIIQGFLWLGSADDLNYTFLKTNKITHILNITTDIPFPIEGIFTVKRIPILDNSTADIQQYFKETHDFIDSVHKINGRILVHCFAGISRSATIVISYLMKTKLISTEKSIALVKNIRSTINPNFGFYCALKNFEKELNLVKSPIYVNQFNSLVYSPL
jgi:hypothetical protein